MSTPEQPQEFNKWVDLKKHLAMRHDIHEKLYIEGNFVPDKMRMTNFGEVVSMMDELEKKETREARKKSNQPERVPRAARK